MDTTKGLADTHGVTADLITEISSPIGLVVLYWGFIEQYFSSIVEATYETAVAAGLKGQRPRQFEGKRAYLEKVFGSVDEMAEYREAWTDILKRIDLITPIRHAYAHGTIGRYDRESEIVIFQKVNPAKSKDHHTIEEVPISKANIDKAADVIADLCHRLVDLTTAIVYRFVGSY